MTNKPLKKMDSLVKHREKGVVLLVTFFIMGIALSIVLGISGILINEIKMIRNIGNSVAAFYAADTGIEQVIYFNNKQIPEGGTRGFCNICNICGDFGCQGCNISGGDFDLITCTDAQVSYSAEFNGKSYNIIGSVGPTRENFKSFGTYTKTTRAIELQLSR